MLKTAVLKHTRSMTHLNSLCSHISIVKAELNYRRELIRVRKHTWKNKKKKKESTHGGDRASRVLDLQAAIPDCIPALHMAP